MPTTEDFLRVSQSVNDIGFVEFTSDLVSSTFETLLNSTLTQLEAYAELVQSVAQTSEDYQRATLGVADVTQPEGEPVRSRWIEENLIDPGLLTLPDMVEEVSEAETFSFLDEEQVQLESRLGGTFDDANVSTNTAEGLSDVAASRIHTLVGDLLAREAQSSQEQLIALLRLGMQRLVVSDGEICSRLTFNVSTTQARSRTSTDVNTRSRGFSIGGSFASRAFRIAGSYGSRRTTVNVVNEASREVLNASTEIVGSVKVRFRTETFPTVDVTPAESDDA